MNVRQPQQRRTRVWTGGVSTGSQSTAEDRRAHPHVCMRACFCKNIFLIFEEGDGDGSCVIQLSSLLSIYF